MEKKDQYSRMFVEGLKKNNTEIIRKTPKSDLHIHALCGGSRKYFLDKGITIGDPPNFNSLSEMQLWKEKNIKTKFTGLDGIKMRIEATFMQAKLDNITVLSIGFSLITLLAFGNINAFLQFITQIKESIYPEVSLSLEIILNKELDEKFNYINVVPYIESGYFSSIDCAGKPEVDNLDRLVKIYSHAKKYELRTKAHIGEFSSADDILKTIKMLNLDEITHGIAAAQSVKVMEYLRKHRIQLNTCPASNLFLCNVANYRCHPIGTLYRNGIVVTINTDDLLIFDHSITEQFMGLFSSGCLSAEELDDIRLSGLLAR